jgi:hypothetical protein
MKKSRVRRNSCITYTTEGKIPGKIADVKIVTMDRCPCRHHQTEIAAGDVNCFSTGIENHRRRFKGLLEKPVASNGQRPARISCKACKSSSNDENNFVPSVAGGSENANDTNGFGGLFRKFPPLHFVQLSHKDGKNFRQNDRRNEIKSCSEKEQSSF